MSKDIEVRPETKHHPIVRVLMAAAIGGLLSAGGMPLQAQQRPAVAAAPNAPMTAPFPADAAPRMGAGESLCLVEPSLEVNVGTPLDGVLQSVGADRGDTVAPGQVLARLAAGVEQAQIDLQAAKAEFGARKRARNEELQRKQLISQQELDELTTEQRLAELELRERQEALKLRAVVSPISGVVVDRYRNRGDLVHQEKIFRIAQLNPLHIETVVPAGRFGRIAIGQTYNVALQLGGGPPQPAKVANVDRVIDAASGTFRVRLVLPNPQMRIPSGQRCQVNFG